MDRKEFIQACGFACLSLAGVTSLLPGCVPAKSLQVNSETDKLRVPKNEFTSGNHKRRSLIVRTSSLSYPIVLYKLSGQEYSALLLQCTHQGNELNVNGDLLTCPAHGSEFTNRGEVVQGPADQKLKGFAVSQDTENIFIHLT